MLAPYQGLQALAAEAQAGASESLLLGPARLYRR
jgi:hypothetical protein